jgi:hypothetical protein
MRWITRRAISVRPHPTEALLVHDVEGEGVTSIIAPHLHGQSLLFHKAGNTTRTSNQHAVILPHYSINLPVVDPQGAHMESINDPHDAGISGQTERSVGIQPVSRGTNLEVYRIMNCFQPLLANSTCAATPVRPGLTMYSSS